MINLEMGSTTQMGQADPTTHRAGPAGKPRQAGSARWSRGLTTLTGRLCRQVRQYGPIQPV